MLPQIDWRTRAAGLVLEHRSLIAGNWQHGSGERLPLVNSATEQTLCELAVCGEQEVNVAVGAARRAFDDERWRGLSLSERKRILHGVADLLETHREELALLEALDVGKPIRDAYNVDVAGAIRCFRWYAETVDKRYDEIAPSDADALALMTREPLGVVAAIVPWNFPLVMSAWKIAPALVTGNSVILKPSERACLSTLRLAQLLQAAGVPEGAFQLLVGDGSTGDWLARHHDVDCVAFTGSTRVGKLLLQASGRSNMKRVWLECGGKTPHIVLADAPNVDVVVEAAAWGIFYNQGEMCTAGSRLLLAEEIYDEFLEKLLAFTRTIRVGDPLDPTTQMGPLVDQQQVETVLEHIEVGQRAGATLRCGGRRLEHLASRSFIEPTIFTDVAPKARLAQEEIFGPVLSVFRFADATEALRLANDTIYGLAAAVWTQDLRAAHTFARKLRAGSVWVNCFDGGGITVPFGGFKQSGIGRDKSLHALDKYSELKTTWLQF